MESYATILLKPAFGDLAMFKHAAVVYLPSKYFSFFYFQPFCVLILFLYLR